jgi:N-glycosylase/DNA lyase
MIARIVDKNTIEVFDLAHFDIDAIMHSGQVFRYFEMPDGGYEVVAGGHICRIFKVKNGGEGDKKTIENCKKKCEICRKMCEINKKKCEICKKNCAKAGGNGDEIVKISCDNADFWVDYFDFSTDYGDILAQIGYINSIKSLVKSCVGLRILRGEFVETVVSFIISANNNIKRFTRTLNALCEKFGSPIGNGRFAFPTIEQLSNITEPDFRQIGCGYRSAYLVRAVGQIRELDIEKLKALPTAELKNQIKKISGVGDKVCACIVLFTGAFHRLECCPVDTWITRAFGQITPAAASEILNHKYAGVAQQYIFYYLQYLKGDLAGAAE